MFACEQEHIKLSNSAVQTQGGTDPVLSLTLTFLVPVYGLKVLMRAPTLHVEQFLPE